MGVLAAVILVASGLISFKVSQAYAVKSRTDEILVLLDKLGQADDATKSIILSALNDKISDSVGQQALGAVSDYCSGDDAPTNMCNVLMSDLTLNPAKDGTGEFIVTVTTTPSTATYFPINVALDLTGTTTKKTYTAAAWYQSPVATWTNTTGGDKLLTNLRLDISTQLSALISKASFQCSTSTWFNGVVGGSLNSTSTAYVLASTTVLGTYDTGDFSRIDTDLATSTQILVRTNEVVFCTMATALNHTTSSDSFSVAGKFTGVGRMLGNIWARSN